MKVRLLADADFNQIILRGVKRKFPAIDFSTPAEGGIIDRDDPAVLEIAARQGRVLVSHDTTTMPDHFYRFIETQDSPGVFLIQQDCSFSTAIESLSLIWQDSEAEEWVNHLVRLP